MESKPELAPAQTLALAPNGVSKLLIIEDSPDILRLMRLELEALGYTVFTASDGWDGLRLAKEKLPDLIISDVKMPGIDGYELIRKLRATPGLASIPAIALTGFGMPKDFERLRAAGFDICIPKPVETEEIFSAIQRLTSPGVREKTRHA